MIKMVTLIKRKPGMSRDDFIAYYENNHAPLTRRLFPQAIRYIRNYPTTANIHYAGMAAFPGVEYDAICEHWYADRAIYDAMMADFLADPEKGRIIAEDEARFCDKESMVMFLVDEHITVDEHTVD